MPKTEIDYSNTIIYKITCKDVLINKLYVGHTTNFTQRKYYHKNSCINEQPCNYKCNLYEVIKNNGGWNNWKMEIIEVYNCADHYEAKKREQECFIKLTKELSSKIIEEYYCEKCNLKFTSLKLIETHYLTHKKETNIILTTTNKNPQNVPPCFNCLYCAYITSNKKDYCKHLITPKHKKLINTKDLPNENPQKSQMDKIYLCKCGTSYKHMSSLCKHKINCKFIEKENNVNETTDKDLILLLIKEHTKLIEQNSELLEVIKNGTYNVINTNNNNTNSNNKTFNLQFFLNETCKDAMNIMDFIDSIKLQLSDLEKVGRLGYVEGISSIITSNLKALDVTQRPVHCTDKKRETLYIKDENKWEKEDEEKKKIRKAIKRVASKNARLLPKFKEAHPDCSKSVSKFSDQYNKIIVESMGGSGDNDVEKEDKIIRNITNHTTINKE